MTEWNDKRTPEQKLTHYHGIACNDKFLSGWGKAEGGISVCIWVVHKDEYSRIHYLQGWLNGRSEMRRHRTVDLRKWRARNTMAHVSIYVVDAEHNSQRFNTEKYGNTSREVAGNV